MHALLQCGIVILLIKSGVHFPSPLNLGWPRDLLWSIEWVRSANGFWVSTFAFWCPVTLMAGKSGWSLWGLWTTWRERTNHPNSLSHHCWGTRHGTEVSWNSQPPTSISSPPLTCSMPAAYLTPGKTSRGTAQLSLAQIKESWRNTWSLF